MYLLILFLLVDPDTGQVCADFLDDLSCWKEFYSVSYMLLSLQVNVLLLLSWFLCILLIFLSYAAFHVSTGSSWHLCIVHEKKKKKKNSVHYRHGNEYMFLSAELINKCNLSTLKRFECWCFESVMIKLPLVINSLIKTKHSFPYWHFTAVSLEINPRIYLHGTLRRAYSWSILSNITCSSPFQLLTAT